MAGKYNDSKINEDEAFFLGRNDLINRWGNIVSSWSMLPGLVGLWPMSSVQRSTGNAYDISGQARTLTYNGNPTYNIYNNFVPYIDFDGAGDYLSRADETDLDILGNEAINAAAVQGLTFGCWANADAVAPSSFDGLIGKHLTTGNQRSYCIHCFDANSKPYIAISSDGTAAAEIYAQSTAVAPTAGIWYFWVARFLPSTELAFFENGVNVKSTVAGVPATLFNSTAAFEIGRRNVAGSEFTGNVSLAFLSHQVFSNALINAMFQQSRILFRV